MNTIEAFNFEDRLIPDANAAKQQIDAGSRAHVDQHRQIREFQEHLDGKRPFDPNKLKEAGTLWMTNRNWRKATAKSEKAVTERVRQALAYFGFGSPVFKYYDPKDKDEKKAWLRDERTKETFANYIRIAYSTTFEREYRSTDMVTCAEYQATNFGYGIITRDEDDWLGDGCRITDVFFPKREHPEDIDLFFVYSERDLQWFYSKWLKAKTAAEDEAVATGWSKEGLEELLTYYWNHSKKGNNATNWQSIAPSFEASLLNGEINGRTAVHFTKMWNAEMNGDVTATYVAYTSIGGAGVSVFTPTKFLYQRTHKDSELCKFFHVIRDTAITSTGVLQDMRGLTSFSVPDSHGFNIKRGAIEDKLRMIGNMQFRQESTNQAEKLQLQVTSTTTILPFGLNPLERPFNFDLSVHFASLQFDEQQYMRETMHYDPSIAGRTGDRATTEEVKRVGNEVESVRQAKEVIRAKDWGRYHRTTLKLLAHGNFEEGDRGHEGQERFYAELIRQGGEDRAYWQKVMECVEDFEMANVLMDTQGLRETIQMVTDPFMRNELERNFLYAMGWPRNRVDSIKPKLSIFSGESDQSVMADFQNTQFWRQIMPIYSFESNPRVHLDVHFARFTEAMQRVEQGADAVEILNYLRTGLTFTPKHLQRMADDPFYPDDLVKAYIERQKGFEKLVPQLERIARKEAAELAQQQQQGQPDPETMANIERDNMVTANKEARKDQNQEAERRRRLEKDNFNRQLQADDLRFRQNLEAKRLAGQLALSSVGERR